MTAVMRGVQIRESLGLDVDATAGLEVRGVVA